MSWDVELQQMSKKILQVLGKYAAHHRLNSLKHVQFRAYVSQHHNPSTGSGHGEL
jgi:hypothetical protein